MIIPVSTSGGGYDIILERGALKNAEKHLRLDRRVLIVTDSGVPAEYSRSVADCCKSPETVTVCEGEQSKCLAEYEKLLKIMCDGGFTRTDCVVAVGGGVVGDLAGFATATYMRGIDFYNIPTTVLSQVDSSIGGKTAVNFGGYKNSVGAFYQPTSVIIDPDVTRTLSPRQLSNGLAEAVKMAMTCDGELFSIFENCKAAEKLEEIIERSVRIKKSVVERDERENGLRRILNFGHTVGHAIESQYGMTELYHGECVAAGMIPMCGSEAKRRLIPVLEKLGLPTRVDVNLDTIFAAIRHDKKSDGGKITVIRVEKIGEYITETVSFDRLEEMLKGAMK